MGVCVRERERERERRVWVWRESRGEEREMWVGVGVNLPPNIRMLTSKTETECFLVKEMCCSIHRACLWNSCASRKTANVLNDSTNVKEKLLEKKNRIER